MANSGVMPLLTASEAVSAPYIQSSVAATSEPKPKSVSVSEPPVACGKVMARSLLTVPDVTVHAEPALAVLAASTRA